MRLRLLSPPALALVSPACGTSGTAEVTDKWAEVADKPPVEVPGAWQPAPD